jgi:hypothetical protein
VRNAAALLTLLLAAAARAEDDASTRAFVEISTARTTRFAGEKFRVALRVGFDETFFRERAIATHRRPVDLRVHVHAPWFDALPTAAAVPEDGEPAGPSARVVTSGATSRSTAATSRSRGHRPR